MEVRTRYLFVILAVGTLLFLFNLGGRDLWEPDESRYAVIAREMRETGNWILPRINGEIYAEKPPLFFWLVNLSTFFLGENSELANRLPSALAGFLTLLVTFLFGERLFRPRVGLLSAMVLGTSFLFLQLSRWMMLDSLVTLFFLLTLYYFYLGVEKEESRRKNYLMAGLFMGCGVLTKGPLAFLPLPIFFVFTFLQKNLRKFWCRDLLRGFLLSAVIALIWWIPACWIGGRDYVHWLLYKQAVGTYMEGGTHFHPEPFYFYFVRFPAEFVPWIVFLPTAFIFGLRKEFDKRKEMLFLTVWFSFLFIFFTLSVGKKDNYLLPLYPAAAMMVGSLWDLGFRSEKGKKGFLIGLLLLTCLFLAGIVVLLSGILSPLRIYPEIARYRSLGFFVLSYLSAGAFLSFLLFSKKRKLAAFIILMIIYIFFYLHLSYLVPPKANPLRSAKAFSEGVLKRMGPGDVLKTYGLESNGLIYYTRKGYIENIQSKDRFLEILNSPQRVYIVAYEEVFNFLQKETGIQIHPIDRGKVGHWKFVLISNR
ncbi:MAG TPA: glycosyltransferase family 39 protein [Thermodesulfobacteriota bacterium]|nr:glycosyltransferase family 39 protein [Thermodesulfobacteriota bacterium]